MPDMRFAPPPTVRIAERSGGMNQVLARSYNERLIMSLLLQSPGLSRMQLGEASGLSAQTISVIVRALEKDNLVAKGEAVRGRIGPPTTPISLNPEGAFAIGICVGHYSLDVVMTDFLGQLISRKSFHYETARLDDIRAIARNAVAGLIAETAPERVERLAGIGLSLPADMGPARAGGEADAILDFDFEGELKGLSGLDVFIQNDVTAAASAECMFGAARNLNDYLYCEVTPHIVPRLVLGGRIYAGQDPAPSAASEASMMRAFLASREMKPATLPDGMSDWRESTVAELAGLTATLRRFVQVRTVIIAGLVPEETLPAIVESLKARLQKEADGLEPVRIVSGALGPWSLAIGAAALPFHSRFMNDSPETA